MRTELPSPARAAGLLGPRSRPTWTPLSSPRAVRACGGRHVGMLEATSGSGFGRVRWSVRVTEVCWLEDLEDVS